MKWLPIETAPKDGGLLLLSEYGFVVCGRFRGSNNFASSNIDMGFYRDGSQWKSVATHWMPLPEPPGSEPSLHAQAKAVMDEMTDDERLSLMQEYCQGCGTKHTPCYCARDD